MWDFDPFICDIVWIKSAEDSSGIINFGELGQDDLSLDAGQRIIEGSIVDGGLRTDVDI